MLLPNCAVLPYVLVGLGIAVVGGTIIEKLHMERYVEDFIRSAGSVDNEGALWDRYGENPAQQAPVGASRR